MDTICSVNQTNKRGGRQYKQFAEAIRRLSAVTYMNDGFYDPIREEHRRVSFRFFSYSLPVDLESSRSWRIAWDPIFFEMVQAAAGHFRFDLAVYRELDAASRRMFLFVSKVLPRRPKLNALRLEHVAINILGFSPSVATRDMKVKVSKCLQNLVDLNVLSDAEVFKTSPGRYFVRLSRGPYFAQKSQRAFIASAEDSPLFETLQHIGFEEAAAARLISKFPTRLLSEWADITQAAIERFGVSYFHKSPMAYLVDSVMKASTGTRTAPDWWQDLKRAERQELEMSVESQRVFTQIRAELFGDAVESSDTQQRGSVKLASIGQIMRNSLAQT
jgi:hypothetical protein